MKPQGHNPVKEHPKKLNGFQSSLSREKFDNLAIQISNGKECPISDMRNKGKKQMKKKKSKQHINLVEMPRKRGDEKSMVRHFEK